MKKLIFLLFVVMIVSAIFIYILLFTNTDKEQAKQFSLNVVKTYFSKDCDTFYSYLADKVYLLGENDAKPFEKNLEIKDILCESISKAVRGEHNFEEYLDSYDISILDKSEYYSEFDKLEKFKPTENDYLFVGYKIKKGKDNFMWDDLLIFMVRKSNDEWKIIALNA